VGCPWGKISLLGHPRSSEVPLAALHDIAQTYATDSQLCERRRRARAGNGLRLALRTVQYSISTSGSVPEAAGAAAAGALLPGCCWPCSRRALAGQRDAAGGAAAAAEGTAQPRASAAPAAALARAVQTSGTRSVCAMLLRHRPHS